MVSLKNHDRKAAMVDIAANDLANIHRSLVERNFILDAS
jgi:hypothetical protein